MIFRQFYHPDHQSYQWQFVSIEQRYSRYKEGKDLFGDRVSIYTTKFKLELHYE